MQQQNANAFANQRQFSAQRQRSLNSPGTPVSRQNSFNSQDSFPEPASPSQAQQQYNTNLFNQQQLRLQRQQSVPQATQHLPGMFSTAYSNVKTLPCLNALESIKTNYSKIFITSS